MPSVRDVFVRAGTAYLATSSGVQSCDAKGDNVAACTILALNGLTGSSVPRSVRVVTSADTSYLVAGTSLGLWSGSLIDLASGGMRENNTVFSGLTESAGSLWIAASAGLYTYSLASTLLGNPKKIDTGPSGLTAMVSSSDVIWTSLSEGIASYDAGDKHWNTWTTNYDSALFGRLVSNDVRTIAITHPVIDGVAHDVIWIGTGSGLSRFDPAIPSFTTYNKADGLPDSAEPAFAHGEIPRLARRPHVVIGVDFLRNRIWDTGDGKPHAGWGRRSKRPGPIRSVYSRRPTRRERMSGRTDQRF